VFLQIQIHFFLHQAHMHVPSKHVTVDLADQMSSLVTLEYTLDKNLSNVEYVCVHFLVVIILQHIYGKS
jgi:hypothetical protein